MILEQPYDLDNRIVTLVHECWNDHQMPLLLSRLGGQDNGLIARETREQAGSLGAYLHRRLADRVRVIQHSNQPPLIGAIPADVPASTSSDSDALLDKTRGQRKESTQRFQPAFWAAFRKHLDEHLRRYVSVQRPIYFRDVLSDDQPAGFIEVERKYVLGPEAESTEVQQQVQAWLADNGLELKPFLLTTEPDTAHLPSDDLLGRLLLALDSDDLRRVSMPLDIVSKLRRQSL